MSGFCTCSPDNESLPSLPVAHSSPVILASLHRISPQKILQEHAQTSGILLCHSLAILPLSTFRSQEESTWLPLPRMLPSRICPWLYSQSPPDLFSKVSTSLGISLPYLHELTCPLPPCHLSLPPSFSSHVLFFLLYYAYHHLTHTIFLLVYLYNNFSLN